MMTITVYKQSDYPVAATEIKKAVSSVLKKEGIISDCVVEIALVGEAKMKELNEKYYKDEEYIHPVFTFTENERAINEDEPFVFPPDGKLYLGEIVISYPHAVETARETGKLVSEIICDLAQHGAMHLMGIHHD